MTWALAKNLGSWSPSLDLLDLKLQRWTQQPDPEQALPGDSNILMFANHSLRRNCYIGCVCWWKRRNVLYKLISLSCYLRWNIFVIFLSWNEAHFFMNCKARNIKQMTNDAFSLPSSALCLSLAIPSSSGLLLNECQETMSEFKMWSLNKNLGMCFPHSYCFKIYLTWHNIFSLAKFLF